MYVAEHKLIKQKRKFMTRKIRRCWRCGRRHGYLRKFDLCRICLGAYRRGVIPGCVNLW